MLSKLFQKKEKPTITQQIFEAKRQLEMSKVRFEDAIEMELKYIRRDRRNNNSVSESMRFARIKNAYYMIGTIKAAKERLYDIENELQYCAAYSDTAAAIRMINKVSGKTGKNKAAAVVRGSERMRRIEEASQARMEKIFDKVASVNDLVSDDVIEELLKGAPLEECVQSRKGFLLSPDSLQDPQYMVNGGGDKAGTSMKAEDLELNFDDFFEQ